MHCFDKFSLFRLNLLTTWKSRLKFNTKKKVYLFSNDEGIKESQLSNSENRESCDMIKGIRTKNAFPKKRKKHSKLEKQAREEHRGKKE